MDKVQILMQLISNKAQLHQSFEEEFGHLLANVYNWKSEVNNLREINSLVRSCAYENLCITCVATFNNE